jgi:hypothetical protein
MSVGWDLSPRSFKFRSIIPAVKKAAPEDLKALIEKVDCFIFDCDGGRLCFYIVSLVCSLQRRGSITSETEVLAMAICHGVRLQAWCGGVTP